MKWNNRWLYCFKHFKESDLSLEIKPRIGWTHTPSIMMLSKEKRINCQHTKTFRRSRKMWCIKHYITLYKNIQELFEGFSLTTHSWCWFKNKNENTFDKPPELWKYDSRMKEIVHHTHTHTHTQWYVHMCIFSPLHLSLMTISFMY